MVSLEPNQFEIVLLSVSVTNYTTVIVEHFCTVPLTVQKYQLIMRLYLLYTSANNHLASQPFSSEDPSSRGCACSSHNVRLKTSIE